MFNIYNIIPAGKPRMTQRDKWKIRPAVAKYRAFCDFVRLQRVDFQSGDHVVFILPMPNSWSKKKKEIYFLNPHRSKPDLDNCLKALCDAVYKDDSILWNYMASKVWGYNGSIVIFKEVAVVAQIQLLTDILTGGGEPDEKKSINHKFRA